MNPTLSSGCISAALLAFGISALGCGTDPVNPDGCRSIEEARCTAIAACPGYQGLDVDACKRFYRDQCLHGLATASDPGEPLINQCVQAISKAGSCAQSGTDPCATGLSSASPCALIEAPQSFAECSFLGPAPGADAGTDEPAVTTDTDAGSDADATGAEVPSGDAG